MVNSCMPTNFISERIDLIAEGFPFQLDNLSIKADSGKLLVTGWTNTIEFKDLSKKEILEELALLKMTFSELSNSYPELNRLASSNLTIEYHMAYSDYSKAGIGLCSEIEGRLDWYIDID